MSDKCTCEHPVRDCIGAENCVGVQRFAELSSHDTELAKVKRQRDALLDALKELVACKDLKALLEYGRLDFNEREFAESDYNMRKPAAWIAAREAISEVQGSPKTSEEGQCA